MVFPEKHQLNYTIFTLNLGKKVNGLTNDSYMYIMNH